MLYHKVCAVIMLQFLVKTDERFRKYMRAGFRSTASNALFCHCASKEPSEFNSEPAPGESRVTLIWGLIPQGLCGHDAAIFTENG